jgi:hypothetical protein
VNGGEYRLKQRAKVEVARRYNRQPPTRLPGANVLYGPVLYLTFYSVKRQACPPHSPWARKRCHDQLAAYRSSGRNDSADLRLRVARHARLREPADCYTASVDRPTINVDAYLPRVSPETTVVTVGSPLRRQLGTIPGITGMTSLSSTNDEGGNAQFTPHKTLDSAPGAVQAEINPQQPCLPKRRTCYFS